MTQTELKTEIEIMRNTLNKAIEAKCGSGRILDISRMLDCLIEEYVEMGQKNYPTGP